MPLTPEEKKEILDRKAATKAAKDARRVERKENEVPKTEQELYDSNPIPYWSTVIESKNPIWDALEGVFQDAISSVTECDPTKKVDIEESLRELGQIRFVIESAENDERKKKNLLEKAVHLQSNSQVPPSKELQSLMVVAQQPIPRPEQARISEIRGFYISEKERLEQNLKVICENEERTIPLDFVEILDRIFLQSHMSLEQRKLLQCTIFKILTGKLTLVEPTCGTAQTVYDHVERQLEKNRNIDGAIAVCAKHCAESTGCLDCMGAQARNVILHHTYMKVEACRKMLHSLLSGHKTALKAFEMYCEYWFGKENMRNKQLVELLFEKHIVRINHIVQKVGFSDEQRTEIVRLMLQKLDMTMEDVDSHISAFLADPSAFP
jgi:hypothetical protein